jgi:hypothetical protein
VLCVCTLCPLYRPEQGNIVGREYIHLTQKLTIFGSGLGKLFAKQFSSSIRPPTEMANPSLESYIDALLMTIYEYFRLYVRCQRFESISEHNFLKISNIQFHPRALTVLRKITHTNEIL